MHQEQLQEQANFINRNLAGKTISGAKAEELWPGCTIIIYFSDGTKCQITSEHDEGFFFKGIQGGTIQSPTDLELMEKAMSSSKEGPHLKKLAREYLGKDKRSWKVYKVKP